MSGKTDETCQLNAVYKSSTNPSNTIPLLSGERFPPCSIGGGHATVWNLSRKA